MSIKRLFAVPSRPLPADLALLLLRLVMGTAFVLHGWGKIQHPLSWMSKAPYPAPPPLQLLAAISEFGGGIALILGLTTPLFAFGLLCTMAVATWTHAVVNRDPFVLMSYPLKASYELPAIYFCVSALFLTIGPGRLSLDRLLFGRR